MSGCFRQVKVSAPSKIILHGEHAVVYGKTAVAASIGLRTRMTLQPKSQTPRALYDNDDRPEIELHFPDIDIQESWTRSQVKALLDKRPISSQSSAAAKKRKLPSQNECVSSNGSHDSLDQICCFPTDKIEKNYLMDICEFLGVDKADLKVSSLICFFYLYSLLCCDGDQFPPLKISIESDIPIGQGLGSSSALSVCLAGGLLAIRDQALNNQSQSESAVGEQRLMEICQLSRVSEQILHGRCSGIDNAVSTFGGLVRFANFARVRHSSQKDLLNNLKLRILLVGTRVPRNTKSLVESVRSQTKEFPSIVQPVIDAIDSISVEYLATLDRMARVPPDEEDQLTTSYERLEALIDYNQKLLASLGVSHPSLDKVCSVASSYGLHGKLTGAGGGGYAYILVPPTTKSQDLDRIVTELKKENFDCWETDIGVDGVIVKGDTSFRDT